jgi:hypothetical protein
MVDAVGFPWAAMVVVGNQLMVMLLLAVFFIIALSQVRKGHTPIKSGDDSLLNGRKSTSEYESTADRSLCDHEHIKSGEYRSLGSLRSLSYWKY